MTNNIVGLDLDGCLYDLVEPFHIYLGKHCIPQDHDTWHEQLDMTYKEFMAELVAASRARAIYLQEPMDFAEFNLALMKDAGADLIVVTNRGFCQESMDLTLEWLDTWNLSDYLTDVVFTKDKTSIWTDYFIDDHWTNIEALHKAGTIAYLRNQPWNERFNYSNRVNNLSEFADLIVEELK